MHCNYKIITYFSQKPILQGWSFYMKSEIAYFYISFSFALQIMLQISQYWVLRRVYVYRGCLTCNVSCKRDRKTKCDLTFRNLASHIQDGRKITLQMPHFIFIQQISVLNILNMLYNLLFFLQNAVYFIMLPCLVSVLLTF